MLKGTLTRKQYWIDTGIFMLGYVVLNLLLSVLLGSQLGVVVSGIAFMAIQIVLQVKRLHDANHSGWFALINLVPGFGFLIAIIVFGCFKSNYVNNKWVNNNSQEDSALVTNEDNDPGL